MAEMIRFYSASDSNIDALKQASCSKSTKKSTLSWMRVLNNWKITHSYTEDKSVTGKVCLENFIRNDMKENKL